MLSQEQIEEIESKLFAQLSIEVGNSVLIYAPTLREIYEIGKIKYDQVISYMLFNKNNIKEIKNMEQDNFYFLCYYFYHDEDFRNMFSIGAKFIFKEEIHLTEKDGDVFFYLGEIEEKKIINRDNFDYIQGVIKVMNRIPLVDEPEYRAANSAAQKMIDMLLKNKAKQPKKKETMNLQSMISGVAWKSNSINILNVYDLNMFQLYDGFYRLGNIDNYNHVLTGIYTGNIDGKKINMSDVNWAKILN